MSEPETQQTKTRRTLRLILLASSIMLLILLYFALRDTERNLKPLRVDETTPLQISGLPQYLAFSEINANPNQYLNQFIRVTGNYTPLPLPTCLPDNGPGARWALIDAGLQMDALGFEAVLQRVQKDTVLTVEGIWRLYQGPYGCGKAPPVNDAWYLEVTKIIEPNPIFSADNVGLNTILGGSPIPTIELVGEPEEAGEEVVITATVTMTESISTATITAPAGATVAATNTAVPNSTPTATLPPTDTPTSTNTPEPGAPTTTPTSTQTPTLTSTPGDVLPTNTPEGIGTPTSGPIPPTIVFGTPAPYTGGVTTTPYP